MSKRNFPGPSYKPLLTTKKPKRDEADDLWGDDIDEDAIEDCFRRATQTEEKENPENDVTLVSSYSIFKAPNAMFTSTQVVHPEGNLQEQVKVLQEKYAEKEGEVSILRSNLQNLRTTSQADEEKKQKEWRDKLKSVEKENKAIKSQLEFKNLEVVNLKQQIAELSKFVNNENNSSPKPSKGASPVKQQVKQVVNVSHKIFINVPKYYPLTHLNFLHLSKTRESDNWREFIHKDVPFLLSCTDVDLNFSKAETSVDKALKLGLGLLNDFQNSLKQIEGRQKHLNSSKFHEITLECAEIVDLLSEILPFNNALRNQLIHRNMALFSSIIYLIGKTESEKTCTKFLSSVITLVCKVVSSEDNYPEKNFEGILKQILLLNPTSEIKNEIISLLVVFSTHYSLLPDTEELCHLHAFFTSLEEFLPKVQKEDLIMSITSNILNLEYNFFKLTKLSQHQKECECLQTLHRLTIRSIYYCLDSHKEKFCRELPMLERSAKILCLIHSKDYDSTQKIMSDYAQLKEIVHILAQLNIDNRYLKSLENMSEDEKTPKVPKAVQISL